MQNPPKILNQYDSLRLIYRDIVLGYSFCPRFKIYFKHLTELDYIELISLKRDILTKLVAQGIPLEKEKLNSIYETGLWDKKDDKEIEELRVIIADNEKFIKTAIVEEQKKSLEEILNKHRLNLLTLSKEKEGLLSNTAEAIANKKLNPKLLSLVCFRDKKFTEPAWDDAEFDEITEEFLEEVYSEYFGQFANFSSNNIKMIGVLPFFLNGFSHCKERPETFIGKPPGFWTVYQASLFSMAARNLNILQNVEGESPEMEEDNINKLVDWYDQQYSILLSKRGQSGGTGITTSRRETVNGR